MDKTLVIFRKFNSGDVLALFPLVPGTNSAYDCLSYGHIGQHSAADPLLCRTTEAAKPAEYAVLAQELRQIGYNLKIGKRVPRNALEIRRNKIKSGE